MCCVRLQIWDESGDHAGGLLPLSATLASSAVFDAFQGESKLDALLHGHSYSGHAAGASAGVAALQIFSQPSLNPAMQPGGGRLKQLWPTDLVQQLSHSPRVESVIALGELHSRRASPVCKSHCFTQNTPTIKVQAALCAGTVLAAEIQSEDGSGYTSSASARVVQQLRRRGIFARPLGSVVYLMVTPTTEPKQAAALLQALLDVLCMEL